MYGALLTLPVLLAGAVLGWWRLRRALASAWSRESPVKTGAEKKAPYRQGDLRVPIAGAGRLVTVLAAAVFALGFLGALRVGLTWVGVQELIDHGHVRSGVVPADGRGVAFQLAIAAQGLAMMVMLPRAACALARRSSEQGVHVKRAVIALVFGLVLALVDGRALYGWTPSPVIYWIQGMIADDVAFAFMSALGLGALYLLERASRNAPPVAPAAIDPGGRSMRLLALDRGRARDRRAPRSGLPLRERALSRVCADRRRGAGARRRKAPAQRRSPLRGPDARRHEHDPAGVRLADGTGPGNDPLLHTRPRRSPSATTNGPARTCARSRRSASTSRA